MSRLQHERAASARKAAANRSERTCPRCLRNAALGSPLVVPEEGLIVRRCNYCGHKVGNDDSGSFGRDVTPEPGARGGRLLPLDKSEPTP